MEINTLITMCFFGFFISLFLSIEFIDSRYNILKIFFITITIIIMLFGISSLFIYGFASSNKGKETMYSTEHVVSLNDDNQINGRFHIRSGYINEEMYYQYMVKMSNGGYVYNKVNSSTATIYFADDNYRVEWYHVKTWHWFLYEEHTIQKIYIPQGSIEESYNIDLN